MFERFDLDTGDLALAFVIWLCSLPLIALLVIPLFGLKVGGVTALVLLIATLLICWGTFRQRAVRDGLPRSELQIHRNRIHQ